MFPQAIPLDFPPLFGLDDDEQQRWPKLPFTWHHAPPLDTSVPQPCQVDLAGGGSADATLLDFDTGTGHVTLRGADGRAGRLAFDGLRRLRLTTPMRPLDEPRDAARVAERLEGRRGSHLPLAEQERAVTLTGRAGETVLEARTLGHVERPEGWYLFEPVDVEVDDACHRDAALLRVFAPRAGNAGCALGESALEVARHGWAATPQALLEAIECRPRQAVPLLGQALVSLGLLTQAQLEQELARHGTRDGRVKFGDALVAQGLIRANQLDAVIVHKMGVPVADLTRLPPDPDAIARLPQRLATSYRALPLMVDGERLIVASDLAMNDEKRRSMRVYSGLAVVPVLARSADLRAALQRIPAEAWSVRQV